MLFGLPTVEKIELPSSVETVGQSVFDGCSNIEEMTLPKIYNNNAYGGAYFNYLFGGYNENASDYVPQSLKKVTVSASEIPTYAFYGCRYIEEINIENATSIGDCAFQDCSSLQNIALSPMLTSIGNGAFGSCISLTNINLPNGLTNIGESAFYDCSSLRTLTLPSSLSHIGDNAFLSCFKLYEIYNLSPLTLETGSTENGMVAYYAKVIHASQDEEPIQTMLTDELVELIGVNGEYIATMYTGGETSLTLGDLHYNGITVSAYSLAKGFINGTSVSALAIGPQVTALSNNCFESNGVLQTVDMSMAMIQSIPDNCFLNCSSLYGVSIPNITKIGMQAFHSCRLLGAVSLHDNVEIGELAFAYCSNLQSIAVPVGATIGENAFIGCKICLKFTTLPDSI